MKWKTDEKSRNVTLGLVLLFVFTSLPLWTDFLLQGTQLQLQLIRIEALKDGWQQFGLTMWAKPDYLASQGFSFATLYGDTFLWIPALLRLCGIGVQESYRVLLVLINAGTVWTAYLCCKKIFQDSYLGLLGSVLYSASVYRMFLLYSEAEIGEAIALAFLPLVLLGAWMAVTESGKNGFVWAALGLSGIFRSHVLTFVITLCVLVLYLLLHVASCKKAAVWKQLVMGGVLFVLLSANALYGALQYVRFGFSLNPGAGEFMQDKGLQIAQLFMTFYQAGASHEFGTEGICGAAPVGLGLVLLLAAAAFVYLLFVYGEKIPGAEKAMGRRALYLGILGCVLSLLCFPWDPIFKLSGSLARLLSAIQAPWHFLQIAVLAFSVLGCIGVRAMGSVYGTEKEAAFGISVPNLYGYLLAGMSILSATYLEANLLFGYDFVRVHETQEIAYEGLANPGSVVAGASGMVYVGLLAIAVAALVFSVIALGRKGEK